MCAVLFDETCCKYSGLLGGAEEHQYILRGEEGVLCTDGVAGALRGVVSTCTPADRNGRGGNGALREDVESIIVISQWKPKLFELKFQDTV